MRNTNRQRIVTLLTAEHPTRLTSVQIAERIDAPGPSVRRTLANMESNVEVLAFPAGYGGRLTYSVRTPSDDAINNARAALGYTIPQSSISEGSDAHSG